MFLCSSASAPAVSALQADEQRIRSAQTPPFFPELPEEGGAAVHEEVRSGTQQWDSSMDRTKKRFWTPFRKSMSTERLTLVRREMAAENRSRTTSSSSSSGSKRWEFSPWIRILAAWQNFGGVSIFLQCVRIFSQSAFSRYVRILSVRESFTLEKLPVHVLYIQTGHLCGAKLAKLQTSE